MAQHMQQPQEQDEPRSGGQVVRNVLLGLLIAAAAIYLVGAAFFMSHFLPNTKVEGKDMSLRSTAALASLLNDDVLEYKAHISGDGLDLEISGDEVDLKLDTRAFADDALQQQNPWLWPAELSNTHEIDVKRQATLNVDKLAAILKTPIDELNKDATTTENATIRYSDEDDKFVIVEEIWGTQIDVSAVNTNIANAMRELIEDIKLDETSLNQPSIGHDDPRIVSAVDEANKYATCEIPLTIDGSEMWKLSADQIKDWVILNDQLQVDFDTEKALEWMKGPLSEVLDTVGAERTYTRPDGATFTVSGGSYGWIINSEELAPIIVDHIKAGNTDPVEVPCYQRAQFYAAPGERDWGDTFIDVDLSAQYARFYRGNDVIWESYLVSGKTSDGHGTPTGVYEVNDNKGVKQTLIGLDEDHDNEPDYKTDVDYWIPFLGNMVAFHDAYWRYSFGGDIYKWNGSHGCINLPYSAAEELYGIADIGTVVVVHW